MAFLTNQCRDKSLEIDIVLRPLATKLLCFEKYPKIIDFPQLVQNMVKRRDEGHGPKNRSRIIVRTPFFWGQKYRNFLKILWFSICFRLAVFTILDLRQILQTKFWPIYPSRWFFGIWNPLILKLIYKSCRVFVWSFKRFIWV